MSFTRPLVVASLARRSRRLLGLVLLPLGLAACGADEIGPANLADEDGPADGAVAVLPDGGDPNNTAPTAAFAASALSVVAGEPLGFDASESADADGDVLRYAWGFGDGVRGGAQKLAHIYSTAGTFEAILTVADGRGGFATASKTITVAAAPTPTSMITATVRVLGPSRTALADATVQVLGGATATTDATGVATISLGAGAKQVLRIEKSGYSRQTQVTNVVGTATSAYREVSLRLLPPKLVLENAAAGGTVQGTDGTKVIVPARALVDGAGIVVTGAVDVQLAPVDVVADAPGFPGAWAGIGPDASRGTIVSLGVADYVFTQAGNKLDLAPGQTATIEIPVYARKSIDGTVLAMGDSIPLWSLDEQSGEWVQEGEGTMVPSATSPTGMAQRAQVSHFSWWNCDQFANVYPLKVRCCIDADKDGVCEGSVACFVGARSCTNPTCEDDGGDPFPQYGASENIAADEERSLDMPGGLTLALEAFGPDGVTKGKYISLAGTSGTPSTTIILQPFTAPPIDQTITLPFEVVTAATEVGTPTKYVFNASAGQSIWIAADRGTNSQLTGTVTLRSPSGTVLKSLDFGVASASFVQTIATAGQHTIEVVSALPKPVGTYRLRVRAVGAEMTAVSMTPAAGSKDQLPTAITVTFARPVKAASVTAASFKVFGPVGEVAAAVVNGRTVNNETITFTPKDGFVGGVAYRVELTTAIKDTTDVTLIEAYQGAFTTLDAAGTYGTLISATSPVAGIASDGSAMVVGRIGSSLYYTRYVPGTGWTAPDLVPSLGADVHSSPRISVAGNGLAVVYWIASPAGNPPYKLRYVVFSPTTGWGSAADVPEDATEGVNSSEHQIAIDNIGRLVATWGQYNGAHGWTNHFAPGAGWAAPVRFDGDRNFSVSDLKLNDAGQGGVAWRDLGTYFARYDQATSTFSAPVLVGGGQPDNIDVDPAGNVFINRNASSNNQWFIDRAPVGTSTFTTFQVPANGNPVNCRPHIAVTALGSAGLFYCDGTGPKARRWPVSADFTSWEAAFDVSAPVGIPVGNRIAASGEDFFIAWGAFNVPILPAWRRYTAGAWETVDTPVGAPILGDNDIVLGSATRVFYVYQQGAVGRLK